MHGYKFLDNQESIACIKRGEQIFGNGIASI